MFSSREISTGEGERKRQESGDRLKFPEISLVLPLRRVLGYQWMATGAVPGTAGVARMGDDLRGNAGAFVH